MSDTPTAQTRTGWMAAAACRDHDPALFFPVRSYGNAVKTQNAQAKAICATCPVREVCAEYGMALGNNAPGIYGGLTGADRRRLRAERRRDQ